MPYSPSPAFHQSSPSNPTGTTSLTLVMMGLAGSITPQTTGRILLMLSGNVTQSTTADGAGFQLSFGTGTAPVNGAAVTGTQVGGLVTMTFLTGLLTVPFALQTFITGATVPFINAFGVTQVAAPLWLDVAVKAVTAATVTLTNLSLSAIEL